MKLLTVELVLVSLSLTTFTHTECQAIIHVNLINCRDSIAPVDSIAPIDSLLSREVRALKDQVSALQAALERYGESSSAAPEKQRRIRVGLSLGYRWLTPSSRAQYLRASVSPLDSTLRITRISGTSYLFSTSVIFDLIDPEKKGITSDPLRPTHVTSSSKRASRSGSIPFRQHLRKHSQRLCLVSNLNLLDFSTGQKELAFNKSIEGGLGIGYRLNTSVFIGMNWEHVHSFQLYDDVRAMEGKKMQLNGVPLLTSHQLHTGNGDLYYAKSLSGWSLKMIVTL